MKIALATLCAVLLIAIAAGLSYQRRGDSQVAESRNVSVSEGTQVVEIRAGGGYAPRVTVASSNMPTILRMKTEGAFDCSSAVVIPSIGYQGYLSRTSETDISVPPQAQGSTIEGRCAMGMYSFQVRFE